MKYYLYSKRSNLFIENLDMGTTNDLNKAHSFKTAADAATHLIQANNAACGDFGIWDCESIKEFNQSFQ